jgi:hypothetical protein
LYREVHQHAGHQTFPHAIPLDLFVMDESRNAMNASQRVCPMVATCPNNAD